MVMPTSSAARRNTTSLISSLVSLIESGHLPFAAIFSSEPLCVAARGKILRLRIPFEFLAPAIRHVEQVTGVHGSGADLDSADWVFARTNAFDPISPVIGAPVKADLGIDQKLF